MSFDLEVYFRRLLKPDGFYRSSFVLNISFHMQILPAPG